MLRTLLAALQYPHVGDPLPETWQQYRALFDWIACHKIQQTSEQARAAMTGASDQDAWEGALTQYLKALGCPPAVLDASLRAQLGWLINTAIASTYRNTPTDQRAPLPPRAEASAIPKQLQHAPYHDACSSDVLAQCIALATALHCTQDGTVHDVLGRVATVLQRDVLPALAGSKTSWSLESVPARVPLKDPIVHDAARVLTAMYVHDIATLQRSIDTMMETIQELTARPWVGSSKGR